MIFWKSSHLFQTPWAYLKCLIYHHHHFKKNLCINSKAWSAIWVRIMYHFLEQWNQTSNMTPHSRNRTIKATLTKINGSSTTTLLWKSMAIGPMSWEHVSMLVSNLPSCSTRESTHWLFNRKSKLPPDKLMSLMIHWTSVRSIYPCWREQPVPRQVLSRKWWTPKWDSAKERLKSKWSSMNKLGKSRKLNKQELSLQQPGWLSLHRNRGRKLHLQFLEILPSPEWMSPLWPGMNLNQRTLKKRRWPTLLALNK